MGKVGRSGVKEISPITSRFRGDLENLRMTKRETDTVLNKLNALNQKGISEADISIVVHNITSKPEFRDNFMKMDTNQIIDEIRSNASFR